MDRWQLISALRQKGRMSRKDIARVCNLSLPTVNKIIKFYLKKGVIRESGLDKSSGGRRPVLYEFNEKVKYAIGVDFEIPELTIVITDLKGKIVDKCFTYLPDKKDPSSVIGYVSERIEELLKRKRLRSKDIVGVGFGAPAFLNQDRITISGKNLPSWKQVPVREILEERLGIPVVIDNDVNFMSLSESYHMDYRDKVLVYLALRKGTKGDIRMGGGVLINGQVFHGAHGNAATLRHAYIDFSSSKRSEEVIEDAMKIQNPQKMILKLRDHLLIPMLNMVVLFDPDRVVINAGILGQWEKVFVRECERGLKHRLQKLFNWNFKVDMARDREMPCAKGAAIYVLQKVFNNPDIFLEKF